MRSLQDEGYHIFHNPRGDGNYQFTALSYFLRANGFVTFTAEGLRKEAVII